MLETRHQAHDRADVADIAVRVPTGGAADAQGAVEVVGRVRPRQHHDRVVGDHMAVAPVSVVPVPAVNPLPGASPIAVLAGPGSDVSMDAGDEGAGGDDTGPQVQQVRHPLLHKGRADHGGDHAGRVHGLAVVGNPGGPPGQVRSQVGPTRGHHTKGVDEYLGADLLGHGLAIDGDGAALR